MRKRVVTAALGPGLGLGAVLAVAACSTVWGFKTLTLAEDASAEKTEGSIADVELPTDGSLVDVAAACRHARWPARPNASDGKSGATITFALKTFNTDPTTTIGLDLDGRCTCPGPSSCIVAPLSSPTGPPPDAETCDLSQGQDVTGNRLLELGTSALPSDAGGFSAMGVMEEVTRGRTNILINLRSYDGLADDPQVEVDLFLSPGTVLMDDAGTPTPPKFDGTDTWQALPLFDHDAGSDTDPNGKRSLYYDLTAYVANNVLVTNPFDPGAGLTGILLRPGIGNGNPLLFYMTEVVLTGTLTPHDGGMLTLENGFFGGRLVIEGPTGILAALADVGLCQGSTFGLVRSGLCSYRDIMHSTTLDNDGGACDALSFGAAFSSTPAFMAPWVPLALAPACQAVTTKCPE